MTLETAMRRLLIAISALLLQACQRDAPIRLDGETQGTTYHITVVACAQPQTQAGLQALVEARLAQIDLALSNYRDDSELSRFNRAPVTTWVALGPDLYALLATAQQLAAQSGGAFDVTVAPLVAAWGFGPGGRAPALPDDAAIAAARAQVGYQALELDASGRRARKQRALAIDVNGIAQGYTVDQVAAVLGARQCTDFLVEIGGELRLSGHNPEGRLWRIGIEKPVAGAAPAQQALRATGVGVTTAGDYHDYFETAGTRYSHTIDPRSGRPVAHTLASVTVIAANATLADGYDTVLEVLGPQAGFAFAREHRLAAYFIVRSGSGFTVSYTPEFAAFLP